MILLSHKLIICHFASRSNFSFLRSLLTFSPIFFTQNDGSVFFRIGKFLPCQNSPFINTAIFLSGIVMSGFPGIFLLCLMNFTPSFLKALNINFSGKVFFDLTLVML